VQRDVAAEKLLAANAGKPPTASVVAASGAATKPRLVQGVYLVNNNHGKLRVVFMPVTTGITGATEIEVLGGLKAGDEVVTGRYKILRSLKSGIAVKRDTAGDTLEADKS
jgi:HlyD family secretion protein